MKTVDGPSRWNAPDSLHNGGNSLIGREAVVVTVIDDKRGRMIAAPHTRDVADGQVVLRHALEPLLQLSLQCRSSPQMAAHVIAYLDRDSGRALKVEVGIITCNRVDIAKSETAAHRDSLQLFSRKVFKLPLDLFELLEYAIRLVFNGQHFERGRGRHDGPFLLESN